MANHLYPLFKQALMEGSINLLADTIRLCLVSSSYVQADSDQFLSILPGGSVIATSLPFTTKTDTVPSPGVFNADSVTLSAVASGQTGAGIIIYKDTGFPATSPLMVWLDTLVGGGPLLVSTTGGDIQINWSASSSRIFAL